jgi:hypothetical protein
LAAQKDYVSKRTNTFVYSQMEKKKRFNCFPKFHKKDPKHLLSIFSF